MKKTLLIFLILLSCSSSKEHLKYKLGKEEFTMSSLTLLKTNGIYLYTYDVKGVNYYYFIRFYKNGKCFESDVIKGDFENNCVLFLNKGERTYFRNEGNRITYEHWGGNYSGYVYVYGVVDETGLSIDSFKPRGILTSKQNIPIKRLKFIETQLPDDIHFWR